MSTSSDPRELVLTRFIQAPPERVYAAWTQPDLLTQWFAPAPWSAPEADLEVRPGGRQNVVMRSPEGQDFPNHGTYLEVVPNERLVLTNALTEGWMPAAEAASGGCDLTCLIILTFTPENDGTRYTARVRHWTAAACQQHVDMGFHPGWGQCTDQLAALVESR